MDAGRYTPARPGLPWSGTTSYESGLTVFHLTDETRRALSVGESGARFFGTSSIKSKIAAAWKRFKRLINRT